MMLAPPLFITNPKILFSLAKYLQLTTKESGNPTLHILSLKF